MTKSHPPDHRISKADIEAKLAEIGGEVDEQIANSKQLAIAIGSVVVAVVLASFFLAGRRRGKKLSTIVEIRRV
ncbi:MAG: hypothetical protein JJE46_10245 [Acidimicrobiia bacterium]|nr:hypothetical protein [Acidimicrobiia bacterium]